jgi:ABC-type Fe3+-citrate transport system substrate-binding protein
MSLFAKPGMTVADAKIIANTLKTWAEAVAERLKDHDKEIAELKAEIKSLKREPRMTVAQRARARGQA